MAATAKRNGVRLIGVVLGVESAQARNVEAMNLLDYGFNNTKVNFLKEKGSIIKEIKLDKASIPNINIVLKDDLKVVEIADGLKHKYNFDVKLNDINLPVKVGDIVGKINVLENGKFVSSFNLTVEKNVYKLSYIDLLLNSLLNVFSGEI